MRFSAALLVGAFAAFASAQSTTTTASASTAESSAQAATVKCINACAPGDVDCQSKCIAVPNPDATQVNATNNCVAACPQGNGTATDNLNYQNCVDACIGAHYFTSGGTPTATKAAGDAGAAATGTTATGTGAAAGKTGTATDKTGGAATGTASGSSAAATNTTNAGQTVRVTTSAFALVGLVAALFAL